MKKSNSAEDYMKSILILHRRNGSVRSSELADEMGVSRPSVCNAMKKLRQQDMVYFGENDCIFFTDAGRIFAEKIYRKHLLISRFLRRIGVSKKTADEEACEIEHAISDETYECLNRFYEKTMQTE
ncbi:MAG: metal-dependent transcriptional regulator [Lachnospiraceae bacterium]|nr:metal-dependent transcriptional regulator [Lachnospiraceae bacterium]